MNILITICARGGSKGIPGKNIRDLDGKPLIAYSIETAIKFSQNNSNIRIELSTDSEEIKRVCKNFYLTSNYIRPEYLGTDTAGKIDVLADLWKFSELECNTRYDYLIDFDVTSPLRTVDDVQKALELLTENSNALNIFSVNNASRNPYFNMVEQKENGYYAQVKELNASVLTRQSAPKVYDMNASFYIYKREFFTGNYKSAITDRSLIYPMNHICFDLDHPIDFEFMTYLFKKDKLGFTL